MVPTCQSLSELIRFMRALPKNANYRNMLKTDFGYDVPADAEPWQPEYFWKYLAQGQFLGKSGAELEEYAVSGAMKCKDVYYVDQRDEYRQPTSVTKAGTPRKARMSVPVHPSGTIVFNEQYKKYDGYANGKVVSRAATIEKVKACLASRYQVTEFKEI